MATSSELKDHIDLLRKKYSEWVKCPEQSQWPFFLTSEFEKALETCLRRLVKHALKVALASQGALTEGVQIGRILVHGMIPHLIWSRAEAYRPVDLFFGDVHDGCRECLKKPNAEVDHGADNPLMMTSLAWREKMRCCSNSARGLPKCWPEAFLAAPDLRTCDKNPSPKFGKWTLRDVLALSRARFPRWAVRKKEVVGSPGVALDKDSIRVLRPESFPGSRSIVWTALQARRSKGTGAQRWAEYARDFATDAWTGAFTWENPSSCSGKVTPVQAAWKSDKWDDTDPWRYHWLSSECCAMLADSHEPPHQAMLGSEIADAFSIVYFEFQVALSGRQRNLKKQFDCKVPLAVLSSLRKYLEPVQRAFRRADRRWESGQTFCSLFPGEMRGALLGERQDAEKGIRTLQRQTPKTFLDRLRLVERLYERRAWDEDDTPVQLALAAMGDMWWFAFQDALVPQYSEFQRFQQLLRGLPDYRDHLTHSIQVFLLGSKILDMVLQKNAAADMDSLKDAAKRLEPRVAAMGLPDNSEVREAIGKVNNLRSTPRCPDQVQRLHDLLRGFEERLTRYQWALASLMHDFALPVEKANELISHLFETFLGLPTDAKIATEAVRDAIEKEQSAHRAFLYGLISRTKAGASLPQDIPPLLGEFAYERLKEDHGFLSAVYVFNQLFEETKTKGQRWWRLRHEEAKGPFLAKLILKAVLEGSGWHEKIELEGPRDASYAGFAEAIVLDVLDAIVKHNAFAKEHRLFFDGLPSHRFPGSFFSASGSVFGSPIPGLLLLCDVLCDWGRLVHPDELRRHESMAISEHDRPEVVRPECQIVKIKATADRENRIKVDYQWRLPYRCSQSRTYWCLRTQWKNLKCDLAPYHPGFEMWEGCREKRGCFLDIQEEQAYAREVPSTVDVNERQRLVEQCDAFVLLKRFWTEVITSKEPHKNRLRFPEPPGTEGEAGEQQLRNPFNRITVDVSFYGYPVCNVSTGKGKQ
jgi:hypothetical protein